MRTVIVVGANGFLGSRIAHSASSHFQVVGLVRERSAEDRLNLISKKAHIRRYRDGELTDIIKEIRPWCVVYAATNYGINSSTGAVLNANVVMPVSIAEQLSSNVGSVFVHIDSFYSKFSGHGHLPTYQLSKRSCVEWLSTFREQLTVVNARVEQLYGPHDSQNKTFPALFSAIITNEPYISLSPGEQRRDFIHVDDASDAITTLLYHHDKLPVGVSQFDIGTGQSTEIKEVLCQLKELAKSTTDLRFGDRSYRVGEPMDSRAEIGGLRELGWSPKIALQEGLLDLVTNAQRRDSCHSKEV